MPAKNVNADTEHQVPRVALRFFAGKPAPTAIRELADIINGNQSSGSFTSCPRKGERMLKDFLSSGVPNAHITTRQRLTSLLDLPRLYRTIDADPAIVGAGVVHISSDYRVTVLRLKNPRHPREIIRLKQLVGTLPKRYSNAQLRRDILTQIADQIGAAIAVTGSSISGNINHIVIALYEEFSSHDQ
ncbi:hypothetical protein [Pseudomonas sp. 25 R 14]|uniref:hypothetical protein n=1 Tax=Pseudomonas sp. 25 R 14 TaxID=1844109 RepID=UPI001EFA5C06|nr:hypothetical protein [Pseudomonas sp. 25 R 14]